MVTSRIAHGIRRAVRRTVVALLLVGALATGYGVAVVWLETHALPSLQGWLLIGPLAGLIALLSASLVVVTALSPIVGAARMLRFLEQMPRLLAAQPNISNRELARRLDCSEAEAADLRQLLGQLLGTRIERQHQQEVGVRPPTQAA